MQAHRRQETESHARSRPAPLHHHHHHRRRRRRRRSRRRLASHRAAHRVQDRPPYLAAWRRASSYSRRPRRACAEAAAWWRAEVRGVGGGGGASATVVVVVGWWEVRWGPGVGGGGTCWCRLAAWPVCSLETACSTAWWWLAPRARGRRRQETSRRGRSRVAEGPPRPLGSAGCPLAVISQGARGAQCGAVPWRGELCGGQQRGCTGYGPVCCRND